MADPLSLAALAFGVLGKGIHLFFQDKELERKHQSEEGKEAREAHSEEVREAREARAIEADKEREQHMRLLLIKLGFLALALFLWIFRPQHTNINFSVVGYIVSLPSLIIGAAALIAFFRIMLIIIFKKQNAHVDWGEVRRLRLSKDEKLELSKRAYKERKKAASSTSWLKMD